MKNLPVWKDVVTQTGSASGRYTQQLCYSYLIIKHNCLGQFISFNGFLYIHFFFVLNECNGYNNDLNRYIFLLALFKNNKNIKYFLNIFPRIIYQIKQNKLSVASSKSSSIDKYFKDLTVILIQIKVSVLITSLKV